MPGSGAHKRNTYKSFYIKKDHGTYAQVSVEMSYDYGMGCGDIEAEGLTRHEEQVVITKVVYK